MTGLKKMRGGPTLCHPARQSWPSGALNDTPKRHVQGNLGPPPPGCPASDRNAFSMIRGMLSVSHFCSMGFTMSATMSSSVRGWLDAAGAA